MTPDWRWGLAIAVILASYYAIRFKRFPSTSDIVQIVSAGSGLVAAFVLAGDAIVSGNVRLGDFVLGLLLALNAIRTAFGLGKDELTKVLDAIDEENDVDRLAQIEHRAAKKRAEKLASMTKHVAAADAQREKNEPASPTRLPEPARITESVTGADHEAEAEDDDLHDAVTDRKRSL